MTLVLAIFASYKASAQWNLMMSESDSLVRVGINKIYNMDFSGIDKISKTIQEKYPSNYTGEFLYATALWWKILLYPDSRSYDKKFLNEVEKIVARCDKKLKDSPSDIVSLFFKGAALGYRGRYYSQRESWMKAAIDGQAAYRVLEKGLTVAPSNNDLKYGMGYYHYFATVLPDKYPFLKPLMSFAPLGTKELGLLELKAAAKGARYANLEAKLVLLQIYYTYEKNYREALNYAKELHAQYPKNPYFYKYLGRCYVIMGDYDNMEKAWLEILQFARAKKEGYEDHTSREAMYYYGLALFGRGQYSRALKYFLASTKMSKKFDDEITGFVIQSNLKAGQIYDLLGDRKKAIKYYNDVLSWKDNSGSRKLAKQYLSKPYSK